MLYRVLFAPPGAAIDVKGPDDAPQLRHIVVPGRIVEFWCDAKSEADAKKQAGGAYPGAEIASIKRGPSERQAEAAKRA